MGRCADYVLYDDPNCFRLFIHARPDARIERIMGQFGLDETQARAQMENTDKSRAQHYKRFTGRDYGKQEFYHLGCGQRHAGHRGKRGCHRNTIIKWCDVRGTHPLSALKQEA